MKCSNCQAEGARTHQDPAKRVTVQLCPKCTDQLVSAILGAMGGLSTLIANPPGVTCSGWDFVDATGTHFTNPCRNEARVQLRGRWYCPECLKKNEHQS